MVTLLASANRDRTSGAVLLVSLALNLFLLGLLGAGLVRQLMVDSAPSKFQPSRTAAERIDRLAATLPVDDADKLVGEFRNRQQAVEAAHAAYRTAQQTVRTIFRKEPFDPAELRSAMAQMRTAKQTLDAAIQEIVAIAAAEMSAAGRRRLSEWSPPMHSGRSTAH